MKENQIFIKFIVMIGIQCALGKKHHYVYNGKEAAEKQFPYIAYVRHRSGAFLTDCTATIIEEDKILTAAHCFGTTTIDPKSTTVYVGLVDYSWLKDKKDPPTEGYQVGTAKDVYIHDNYNMDLLYHDLAVITMEKPFTLTEYVQLGRILPQRMLNHSDCTLVGFGDTETIGAPVRLRYVSSMTANHVSQGCLTFQDGDFYCVPNKGGSICVGDSGGPLVCDDTMLGVASFSLSRTHTRRDSASKKCGGADESVYTDLSVEEDFLDFHFPNRLVPAGSVQSDAGRNTLKAAFCIKIVLLLKCVRIDIL